MTDRAPILVAMSRSTLSTLALAIAAVMTAAYPGGQRTADGERRAATVQTADDGWTANGRWTADGFARATFLFFLLDVN